MLVSKPQNVRPKLLQLGPAQSVNRIQSSMRCGWVAGTRTPLKGGDRRRSSDCGVAIAGEFILDSASRRLAVLLTCPGDLVHAGAGARASGAAALVELACWLAAPAGPAAPIRSDQPSEAGRVEELRRRSMALPRRFPGLIFRFPFGDASDPF